MKNDDIIKEAAKHFSVTDDGRLSRDSMPYHTNLGKQPKMGVGIDRVGSKGYLMFDYRSERSQKRSVILSHRMIFYLYYGYLPEEVDHIDIDKLNNRKENLRAATCAENQKNRKSRKNSSSKHLGVSWCKRYQKWHARIKVCGIVKHLGYFTCEIEAAEAYDKAAREYYGEFANPNFD